MNLEASSMLDDKQKYYDVTTPISKEGALAKIKHSMPSWPIKIPPVIA